MKSIRLFPLVLFFLHASSLSAVPPSRPSGLVWDATTLTFSAKPEEAGHIFNFHFHNQSSQALVITAASCSCSCTTADLPRLPWLVAPFSDGTVPIKIDIAGKTGTISHYVDLSTTSGTYRLYINVQIVR